jgi:hypothetical protein
MRIKGMQSYFVGIRLDSCDSNTQILDKCIDHLLRAENAKQMIDTNSHTLKQ